MTSLEQSYPIPESLPSPVINDAKLPLISIVTPSFNQGIFIRETIESVLTQEYPNLEYWVIDGGSTDQTLNVLLEYEHDPRFNWISEPDYGQSDAINKGLVRCQGDIFGWLNSDDVYLPNALARIAQGQQEVGRPAILYGLSRYIDEHGKDLGYCAAQSSSMTLEKALQIGKYMFIQPSTFAHTSLIRKLGGVDRNLHYMFDVDLWLKLAELIPIKFVSHDLALYRLHSTSKTVALTRNFINDAKSVMDKTVERKVISSRKAQSRYDLFALRTYLMPEIMDFKDARKHFFSAIPANPFSFVEAVMILLKAILRVVVGEDLWKWARHLKARLS